MLVVVFHVLLELLVASVRHAIELEVVPSLIIQCLGVALEHGESRIVDISAIIAHENAKRHDEVGALVFLAI